MAVAALLNNPLDNVAVAVRALSAGERVTLAVNGCEISVKLVQSIPPGHKFAVRDIPAGQAIIKYGETIGKATTLISSGQHVHLHNLEGMRGRGDLT